MVVSESSSREAAGLMQKTQMSNVGGLVKFGGETSPLGHNHLQKSFSCISGDVGDTELEWNMFKASIVKSHCVQKVMGACQGGIFRTCWWTPEGCGYKRL